MGKTIEVDQDELAALIAKGVAAAMAGLKAEAREAYKKGLPEKYVKADAAIAKAFEKKGYKDIVLFNREKTLAQQPDVTVLTFQKWMEVGRRVKEQEHAVKYKQFRLFHKSQTRIATPEERKVNFAKMQEAIKKFEAEKAAKAAGQTA